ncbi:MAG: methionyl-tRNA formyltransferase [Paludibacteraceae bacterium]|nr:methionyl-tRNA formyltransferase [Paludibacteraceae bacterium]
MSNLLRIIYMGTPEFAVAPLKALVDNGYNVVAVVTMPDKPAQRGMKLQYSAVKQYALEAGLPVLQPEKLKDPQFLKVLRSYSVDLQIVVAFRMLPEAVWNMPPKGTFNLHASLLPQYRGAAPINWAIINGEKETGVTTFFLNHNIDTGNIIMQERTPINPDDNIGTLYDRLMQIGAGVVLQTVDKIASGSVKTYAQDESQELKPAPKIFKEDCLILWDKSAKQVNDFVRGLSPYPAAYTTLKTQKGEEIRVKVLKVLPEQSERKESIGAVLTDNKSYIKIAVKDGYIYLDQIQPAGKKVMTIKEFLNGYKIKEK